MGAEKKRLGFDWYKIVAQSRQEIYDLYSFYYLSLFLSFLVVQFIFHQESIKIIVAAWALDPAKAIDFTLDIITRKVFKYVL